MVRGETDKKAANFQARSLELWTKLGRNAHLKEMQKWSHEQPKLGNARKLRGIYFIDPEDKTPMAPAMLCKTSKNSQHGATRGKSNEIKSKLVCILEVSESTRLRMEESLPNHHEDHIAEKGASLLFGTHIYFCASSHEDSRSKGSSG